MPSKGPHGARLARISAHQAASAVRVQHHDRAENGGPAPWRGHRRHEHGQSGRPHAQAHRRQADRSGTAAGYPRLFGVQGESPGCAARLPTGTRTGSRVRIDPDSEAIVTIGSKEGLAHLMLATWTAAIRSWFRNPSYPIHIYGAIIAGADIRSVRTTHRDGLLRGAGARDPRILSEAADDGAGFPEQSDRAVRRSGLLPARGRTGARARHLRRARSGLRRHRVRRLPGPLRSCKCPAPARWRSSFSR